MPTSPGRPRTHALVSCSSPTIVLYPRRSSSRTHASSSSPGTSRSMSDSRRDRSAGLLKQPRHALHRYWRDADRAERRDKLLELAEQIGIPPLRAIAHVDEQGPDVRGHSGARAAQQGIGQAADGQRCARHVDQRGPIFRGSDLAREAVDQFLKYAGMISHCGLAAPVAEPRRRHRCNAGRNSPPRRPSALAPARYRSNRPRPVVFRSAAFARFASTGSPAGNDRANR